MLVRRVFQGRTKPARGARIDWSHPRARGLVCCLLFDEPAGLVRDLATGIIGTPTNGPTRRVHLSGPELHFAKASDQYVNLGNPAQLQLTSAVTIATEYRLDSIPAANLQAYQLVAKDKDTGGRSYVMDLYRNTTGQGVRFYFNGGGTAGTADAVAEGRNPVAGDERQVVGTYRSSDRQLGLYVNGRLVDSKIAATTGIPAATANVLVARREYAGFTNPFDGSIRYVLIWNRVLPAQEVSQLYNPATRWEFLEPVRTWSFRAVDVAATGQRSHIVVVG